MDHGKFAGEMLAHVTSVRSDSQAGVRIVDRKQDFSEWQHGRRPFKQSLHACRKNGRVARVASVMCPESQLQVQIVISAGDILSPPPICQSIAKGKKVWISGMRPTQPAIVPDGTKMLFGAARDFRNKREQSIGVGTVNTADPLYSIEIRQTASIENQVVSPPDLRDAVHRKANCLIEQDEQASSRNGIAHK